MSLGRKKFLILYYAAIAFLLVYNIRVIARGWSRRSVESNEALKKTEFTKEDPVDDDPVDPDDHVVVAIKQSEVTCKAAEISKYKVGDWMPPPKDITGGKKMKAWILVQSFRLQPKLRTDVLCLFQNVINAYHSIGYHVLISNKEPDEWHGQWTKFLGHDYGNQYKSLTKFSKLYSVPNLITLHHKNLLIVNEDLTYTRTGYEIPENVDNAYEYAKLFRKDDKKSLWVVQQPSKKDFMLMRMKEFKGLDKQKVWLVSEYISNPLLIENRMVELSAYIAIMRTNPLTIYVYEPEWLIKRCLKEYKPFNRENIDSYMAHDTIPVMTLPNKTFQGMGIDIKQSDKSILLQYLKKKGHDIEKFQKDVKKALVDMAMVKQIEVKESLEVNLKDRGFQYFELYKVNIVPDANLRPWITEIERRPYLEYGSLMPKHHRWMTKMIRESLELAGLHNLHKTMANPTPDKDLLDKITLKDKICGAGGECAGTKKCLSQWKCLGCIQCMKDEEKANMKYMVPELEAKKPIWQRVMPRPYENKKEAENWKPQSEPSYELLSNANKVALVWTRSKCMSAGGRWCN